MAGLRRIDGISQPVTLKTDIWSFGCVVLDMLLGLGKRALKRMDNSNDIVPFEELRHVEAVTRLLIFGAQAFIPAELRHDMHRFLSKCLERDSDDRKSAAQLLTDSFLYPLAEYEKRAILANEWQNLRRKHCPVDTRSDSSVMDINFPTISYLEDPAALADMRQIFQEVGETQINRPLKVTISCCVNWMKELEPVKDQIVSLKLITCHAWSSSDFAELMLPNLVQLSFHFSEELTFKKGHLLGLPNLKALTFHESSIAFMEENVLEELENLVYFGPYHNSDPVVSYWEVTLPAMKNYDRFHNSEAHRWLRKYLEENPTLCSPKTEGEVWRFGSSLSEAFSGEFVVLPEKWQAIQKRYQNMPSFKMNKFEAEEIVVCLLEVIPMERIYQYDRDNGMRIDLHLPHNLVTFDTSKYWSWVVGFDSKKDPKHLEDVQNLLRTIVSWGKDHPLEIAVSLAEETLTPKLIKVLTSIGPHITTLVFEYASKFDASRMRKLNLPNLLELKFIMCKNVSIKRDGLKGFPSLRSFIMEQSTIGVFEENIFWGLPQIRQIALTYKVCGQTRNPPPNMPKHFYDLIQGLSKSLHREENLWIVPALFRNPHLMVSKTPGEVYEFSKNGYYYRSDGYTEDDCLPRWIHQVPGPQYSVY